MISPIKHIAIIGGGTAGWMAASLMQKHWKDKGIKITLIEAPDIGIVGVGEGSTPQLKAFFTSIGIEEKDWMPKCNATYKNGISFTGWSGDENYPHYFHPFTCAIDTHSSPGFFFNSHYRRQGFELSADPNRFFLSAYLAQHNLAPISAHNFPFDMAYGYHFDSYLVGEVLAGHAKAMGIDHKIAKVQGARQDETGQITSLDLEDGDSIDADFFVDATGFRAMLMQKTLGVKFLDFSSNLFNDAAVVMPAPTQKPLGSQTLSTALTNGWAWSIPLTNRTGHGYVYSSKYIDKDSAETELRTHLGLLESDINVRHLKMKVGQVEKHWHKNCLAIGLSQGFIEPLEATALHLVQATIEQFIYQFERGGFSNQYQSKLNQDISSRFEGIRDYIVAHYRLNTRKDTQYWRDNAANENLSDSLRRLMQCWFSGADIKAEINQQNISQYYSLTSWVCLFGGYGHYPNQDLKAAPSDLKRFDIKLIDDFISRCGLNFQDHREFLDSLKADV